MALVHNESTEGRDAALTPETAVRAAWIAWLTLLLFPLFVFLYVVWTLTRDGAAPKAQHATQQWFIATMAYMVLAIPVSMMIRGRYFNAYYQGEIVAPTDYLKGALVLWIAMEIGGLLGLTACLVTHSLLPNLIPSMVAFVVFLPFWPSGRPMIKPLGQYDDPAKYEEPK